NGLVRGGVVMVTETTEADIKSKYPAEALRGKWVMRTAPPEVAAYFTAPGSRYTKEQLDRMENPPPPDPNAPARGGRQGQGNAAAGAPGRAGAPPAGSPPPSPSPAAAAAGRAAGAPA